MTMEAQQQHETVTAAATTTTTTTTTTQSNVHKLPSVQELIFPIPNYYLPLQQLNIK